MQLVIARDASARFRFASLQSETGRRLLAEHGIATDSMVLIEEGQAYVESEAALRVAGSLGAPWSWLALGRVVPLAMRDALYRWVARNRHRWFGRPEACRLPTPELRSRFLE